MTDARDVTNYARGNEIAPGDLRDVACERCGHDMWWDDTPHPVCDDCAAKPATPRDVETLIARLRNPRHVTRLGMGTVCEEAADMIARQRTEIADLTAKLAEAESSDRESLRMFKSARDRAEQAEAEIARLTRERDEARDQRLVWRDSDGDVHCDFDYAKDRVISLMIYRDGTVGWSARVGGQAASGTGPLPQWVINELPEQP